MCCAAGKPPSERIQFLLGQEDVDEDHQTHDIFCEMGELRDMGDEYEWKETARYVRACDVSVTWATSASGRRQPGASCLSDVIVETRKQQS